MWHMLAVKGAWKDFPICAWYSLFVNCTHLMLLWTGDYCTKRYCETAKCKWTVLLMLVEAFKKTWLQEKNCAPFNGASNGKYETLFHGLHNAHADNTSFEWMHVSEMGARRVSETMKKAVSSDMFWNNEHFLAYKFDISIIHNCIVRRPSSTSSSSLSAESKTGNCNNIQSNNDDDDDEIHRIKCVEQFSTWKWQDIVVDEIERTKSCALYVCQITLRLKRERRADDDEDDGGGGVGSLRKQLHYRATWYSFKLDAVFMFRFYAHVCLCRFMRLFFFHSSVLFFSLPEKNER